MKRYIYLIVVFSICAVQSALAIDVVEFDTQRDLERYQQLTYELRCPKCQNQNLIDSDSQISEDLRLEVARLIKDGKSDAQIKSHMVALYGDFILYRPPLQNNTVVLWLAPLIMLGVGGLIFGVIVLRRSRTTDDERSEDVPHLQQSPLAEASTGEAVAARPDASEGDKIS